MFLSFVLKVESLIMCPTRESRPLMVRNSTKVKYVVQLESEWLNSSYVRNI